MPRYYADALLPDGTTLHGIAEWTCKGWLFVDESGFTPFYCAGNAVTLGANVAIFEAKAAEEGALWRQCAAPQYPTREEIRARQQARLDASTCRTCGTYGCPG